MLLDAWASMDGASWTRQQASVLYDQLAAFWQEHPREARRWWREWRKAHPDAVLR